MQISVGGALLVYLTLFTGLLVILGTLYLAPRKAREILLVDRQGVVVQRYCGEESSTGWLRYRDRSEQIEIYLGDTTVVHPKAEWFAIRIRRE